MPFYMTCTQPAVIIIWHSVRKVLLKVSKWQGGFFHSYPRSKQSYFVSIKGSYLARFGSLSIQQCINLFAKKYCPKIPKTTTLIIHIAICVLIWKSDIITVLNATLSHLSLESSLKGLRILKVRIVRKEDTYQFFLVPSKSVISSWSIRPN